MKNIGIYSNADKDKDFAGTAAVIGALGAIRLTRDGVGVFMDISQECAVRDTLGEDAVRDVVFLPECEMTRTIDVMIVLGGDGTLLKAARRCSPAGIPLLGINLGRVGYMAELEINELHMLGRLIDGKYNVESRMMLDAAIPGKSGMFALNDAVLGAESVFRMVDIELCCDGKIVNHYRCDGLIVSTPTGSTAYSLSAGGPVIDPCMDAIAVTPVCAHSLSAAPIVFSASSVLEVRNLSKRSPEMCLSLDGSEMFRVGYGESVRITKSPLSCGFGRLKDGGFYEVLRRKMAESI